jgi:N-acyl-D-amino-acid deacylase
MTHDIVIRGGTIADGSGEDLFTGDVALRDGVIAAVGHVAEKGREEIDARGLLVTPGFVDIHTHYDGQVTWEERLIPSSNHGVTTVIMGNCGVGFAPARPHQREIMIRLMEGVEDVPAVVMAEGVPFNWETFPQYLDALSKRKADVDFAAQLPHSPLRVYVMGERGASMEPATARDLLEMQRLVKEAVEAGALGVTTSRAQVHRFKDGRFAPSVKTSEVELSALAGGLRDAGSGVFQLAPNIENPAEQEFGLMRRLTERSGRPLSFTLTAGIRDDWHEYLDRLSDAKQAGLPIRGQVIPHPVGLLYGLDLSLHPFSLNPSYRLIADLPLPEKVARMRDREFRERLLREEPQDSNDLLVRMIKKPQLLFPLGDSPNYTPRPEDSICARAKATGRDERDLIYDELLRDEGQAILFAPQGNIVGTDLDVARRMLKNDHVIVGLGDGGAHYGMICDAGLPTWLLTACVRDAAPDQHRLELPRAIRSLSRETAVAVGLYDRGLVKPGLKADINVIDYERLSLHRPKVKRDLPAGGRRLHQTATGYVATIVSGQVTYLNAVSTGSLPGQLVRGARSEDGERGAIANS